ncbi:MAG: hypothetical protein AAF204_02690 [Pseudomonadota bacterium]
MSAEEAKDNAENAEGGAEASAPEVMGDETQAADGEAQDAKPEGGDEQEKKVSPSDAPKNDKVATLQGKVEILCDQPVPIYNSGNNKAYRAVSKDKNRSPLIAIVCERDMVPRQKAAALYKTIINPILAKLVISGPVYWPPAKKEHFVLIYFDNLGKPILEPGKEPALGWKQDDVMAAIVRPMVNVLQDFRDKDFVHGAIRPDNMFDGGSSGKISKVLLGDCLSAPPSSTQPVVYETVQRGMADPIARGKGTLQDDLYALGITLAVAMRQRDPLKGLSDNQIVQKKIEQGSYAAVTGKDRFKGEILELLRGLLHDDPSQRWTIDEVMEWMDGRRLSPKQAAVFKKAPRPLTLGEAKFSIPSLAAMHLEEHISEVKKAIEDDSLQTWLERSLEDEAMSERFQKAVIDARQQSTGSAYEYCLASNLSIALDTDAPLRFKGRRLLGDGIGYAMVQAIVSKTPLRPMIDIFMNSTALNWLGNQNPTFVDVTGLFQKFERCRRFLKTSKFGEGVERTVYSLCPESPCLSPIIEDYYVSTPDELLLAFDSLCRAGKVPNTFLDLHSVAFLYEKDSKVIEPYLYDLNTHENHRTVAANVKCMAAIQKRYSMENMPALAKALAPKLQAVVKRYHDRRVQEKLKESVIEFQNSGDLKKIAGILDNVEVVKKDIQAFKKAMVEFDKIEKERQKLEMNLDDKDKFGVNTGREISAIVSCVIAVIIIAGTSFMFMSDNSPF